MNLQDYLDGMIQAKRAERLADSDQLTLGEMILKLEPMVRKYDGKKEEDLPVVKYDFGNLFPTTIDSWRGSYSELALDYSSDYNVKKLNVISFYNLLKGAVGKTFEGYKGGDFLMSKNTPVWVDNYGEYSNTAVIEIVDNDYEIIIMTAYREY